MPVINVNLIDTFEQWRIKTNNIGNSVGDLELLTTTAKDDVISAVNEINNTVTNAVGTVVENDTAPNLGGNLSLNSNDIDGTGNINITGNIIGTIVVGGDLSGTVDNATLIDDSVTGTKIANTSITLDKLNTTNVGTTGQILANDGTGQLEWVSAGASDPAVGGDVAGTISNIQIPDNTIVSSMIADGTVSIAELNVADGTSGQVLSRNGSGNLEFIDFTVDIADDAVTEAKIANNAVTESKIATGAVTGAKIASNTVTESKISAGAIVEVGLASNSVTTDKIDNNAITTPKFATSGTLPAWDGSQLTNLPSTSGWVESQGQNSAGVVEFDDVSEVDILYTPSFQGGSVGTDGLDHSWTRIMFYDLSYNSGAAVAQPLGLQILNNSGGTNAVGSYNYITHDIYGSSDGTTANHTAIKTDSLSSNGSQIIMNAFGGSTQSTGWFGGVNEDTSLIIDIPNSGGKLKSKMIHTRYWHGGNSGTGGSGPHMVDTLAKADQGPNGYQIHGVRIFSVGSSTTNNLTGKYVVLKTIPASGNPF